jgi:mannosyltransferase
VIPFASDASVTLTGVTLLDDAPARASAAPGRRRPPSWVLVAGAVTVAFGVGLFFYTRSDMWLDEALTVNIARLPLGDLRGALERDGAPPLYYVLLHIWTGVFGGSDIAARSLSGVCALAAVVVCWFAARRWFDERTAWLTVIVLAANPFLIRYATEARMYTLEILLVACGIIAVPRALERASIGRLACVSLVTALLVYTQYWAFYLVGVVGATMLLVAWRQAERRREYLMVAGAIGVGLLCFVPWLPTFLSQRAHTGTPWGVAVLPGLPIGMTFLGFAGGDEQEGWVLVFVLVALLLLGLFARALDGRRLEVDLGAQPAARWLGIIGGATLVVGVSLNYLAGQAFAPRYSAIVFPFFALLIGRGLATLVDRRVQFGAVALIVAFGLIGGLRGTIEQRTQAGQVAHALVAEAKPGDLVVYCPDQLGPAVHRLLPEGYDEVTYPAFAGPAFVDWVDYQKRLDATDPAAFAADVLQRAGDRPVWLVTGPGYPNHHGACDALSSQLATKRAVTQVVTPNDDYFEKPGLQEFAPTKQ